MALDKVKDDMLQDNLVFPGSTAQFPSLTTTQRNALSGVQPGTLIYNSTLGKLQQYDGNNQWATIDSPPVISSVTYPTENGITATALEASGTTNVSETLIINGSNFSTTSEISVQIQVSGSYVAFASSVSVNSSRTQITCTGVTKRAAADDYVLKVTNVSGLSATTTVNFSADPAFTTAASLGTVFTGNTLSKPIAFTGVDVKQGATAKPTWMTVTGNAPSGSDANGAGATAFLATGSPATLGGTAANSGTTNNYTFSIIVRDAQNQTFNRDFTLTVTDAPVEPSGVVATDWTHPTTNVVYRVIKFVNASSTFTTYAPLTIDYLVIGGGGGGGNNSGSGGGGAGAFRTATGLSLSSAGAYTIEVGTGGAYGSGTSSVATNGNPSRIKDTSNNNLIEAIGGGGGGSGGTNGANGGSGGGGGPGNSGGSASNASYGNDGGDGGSNYFGGGGGGAGADGNNGWNGSSGDSIGGDGATDVMGENTSNSTSLLKAVLAGTDSSNVATSSSTSGTIYIAGGGGGMKQNSGTAALGGKGGGSTGGYYTTSSNNKGATTPVANTGSGGGGAHPSYLNNGGAMQNGASGIVIIRYAK